MTQILTSDCEKRHDCNCSKRVCLKVWSTGCCLLLRSKTPQVGRCSERMRSCDRDAKGFARSKDTSLLPSHCCMPFRMDGPRALPLFSSVRRIQPTSLRLRALNRRLITRPDTKGIGLDLDSTDERAPWKTLKRVSRWQRGENGKGGRMGRRGQRFEMSGGRRDASLPMRNSSASTFSTKAWGRQ